MNFEMSGINERSLLSQRRRQLRQHRRQLLHIRQRPVGEPQLGKVEILYLLQNLKIIGKRWNTRNADEEQSQTL